jgi:hypothetical protein
MSSSRALTPIERRLSARQPERCKPMATFLSQMLVERDPAPPARQIRAGLALPLYRKRTHAIESSQRKKACWVV